MEPIYVKDASILGKVIGVFRSLALVFPSPLLALIQYFYPKLVLFRSQ